MAIIVSKNHKDATKLEEQNFGLEDHLQAYIADVPESVPIYEIEEDARLFIAAREFSTNSGPIDALGFDQYGNIYVIETKLYKNSDKRMVVAQALDYGASLWRHKIDFDEFLSQLSSHTEKTFSISFKDKFEDFFQIDSTTAFENMQKNLSSGVIKFVVLMDKLHDRLKDLIVYVNQNSKFDLYAVELEYYKHNEFEIIIPKLFGSEVKKDVATKNTGGSYVYTNATGVDFDNDVRSRNELSNMAKSAMEQLRKLFESKMHEGFSYYNSETAGQFGAIFRIDGKQAILMESKGGVWFYPDGRSGGFASVAQNILRRLISENMFGKTEKHFGKKRWGVLFPKASDEDIRKFVEICEEELR